MGDGIRIAILALVVSLSSIVLLGCSDDPTPGPGEFASPCDENDDCKSLVCAGLEGQDKLCSVACTDPLGDECDPGFRCRRPEDSDGFACICASALGCARGNDPDGECQEASDCDDGVDCTQDACIGQVCQNRLAPDLCALGESCRPLLGGCTLGEPCTQDFECERFADDCTSFALCNSLTERCSYGVRDDDGDGFFPASCGGEDCDDFSSSVLPAGFEQCDAIDNDCDDTIDEGASENSCGGQICSAGSCGGSCSGSGVDCSSAGDGSGCVDLNSDPSNCGDCGRRCSAPFSCFDGLCGERDRCLDVACPSSSTCVNVVGGTECRCDLGFEPNGDSSACIDLDECARGLSTCGTSAACQNFEGGFECLCAQGFELLGGDCFDINECFNGLQCGTGTCINLSGSFACSCDFGSAIDPGTGLCQIVNECQAGTLAGHAWCDGGCRDTTADPSYCGNCQTECIGQGVCIESACACSDSTLMYCDGICVNGHTSTADCGFCGNSCPIGASCVDDQCQCPGADVTCGDTCVPLGTTAHCLNCDDSCAVGASCTNTGCACPNGQSDVCSGTCTNTQSDNANCGFCGNGCITNLGQSCQNGTCQCSPELPNACPDGCWNFQNDKQHCGNCVTQCSGMCMNGECHNEG